MSEVSATRTMTAFRACERPSARAATPARRDAALDRGVDCAATRAGRAAARSRANIVRHRRARRRMATHSTTFFGNEVEPRFVGARRAAGREVCHRDDIGRQHVNLLLRHLRTNSHQESANHPAAAMVAVKAAVTKTVSAQPGSAGSNPFSTVNVSPFLWCVPARPRRANPSRAFSPRAPVKASAFTTRGIERTARDLGDANARAPGPRRRAPRLRIHARASMRATAPERVASRGASPAPRPREVPLRTSFSAATLRCRRATLSPCLARVFRLGVFFSSPVARVR